jgi:hypothetical protein
MYSRSNGSVLVAGKLVADVDWSSVVGFVVSSSTATLVWSQVVELVCSSSEHDTRPPTISAVAINTVVRRITEPPLGYLQHPKGHP